MYFLPLRARVEGVPFINMKTLCFIKESHFSQNPTVFAIFMLKVIAKDMNASVIVSYVYMKFSSRYILQVLITFFMFNAALIEHVVKPR